MLPIAILAPIEALIDSFLLFSLHFHVRNSRKGRGFVGFFYFLLTFLFFVFVFDHIG